MTFKKIHLWSQALLLVYGQITAYVVHFPLFFPGWGKIFQGSSDSKVES